MKWKPWLWVPAAILGGAGVAWAAGAGGSATTQKTRKPASVTAALRNADASLAASFAASAHVPGFPPKAPRAADLVLRDASVATLIPNHPKVQAVAIRDGKIEAVGSDKAIARYIGPH